MQGGEQRSGSIRLISLIPRDAVPSRRERSPEQDGDDAVTLVVRLDRPVEYRGRHRRED